MLDNTLNRAIIDEMKQFLNQVHPVDIILYGGTIITLTAFFSVVIFVTFFM